MYNSHIVHVHTSTDLCQTHPTGEQGQHRSELINWYLGEVEEDIENEQELIETKLLVEMVIERLVKHVSG